MKLSRTVSDKYSPKSAGRIDGRKLGFAMLIGSCIVILAYFFSLTGSNAGEELSNVYKVQTNSVGGVVNVNLHNAEPKKLVEDLPRDKEAEKRITVENLPTKSSAESSTTISSTGETMVLTEKPEGKIEELMKPRKPACDELNSRADVCEWNGDVRTQGKSRSVFFVTDDQQQLQSSATKEWLIRPIARKGLENIPKVSVKLSDAAGAPQCTKRHNIPAVVFSTGGFIGNYYHDYTDVIVPLFTTAHQFDGEVQFLVSNIQPWWLGKYRAFLSKLSRYPAIDFDADEEVRCFPRVYVGMIFHNDLTMDPKRTPEGISAVDFQKFMRGVYGLKREEAIDLNAAVGGPKPRLLLIARGGTRKFMNAPAIADMAREVGFEVTVTDSRFGVNVTEFAGEVNGHDVMVGVHGAGLTNFVFLPRKAVLVQVVPYGNLERMAKYDFGFPSMDAELHYLQYSIGVEESTLLEIYPRDDDVFTDTAKIHKLGWNEMGKIYLVKQNVKIDVERFRPVLEKARQLLHR